MPPVRSPARVEGTPPHPAVRTLFAVFIVLTATGCTSLLVLSERTAELFAWTIRPPLTAAFLGAGYGAGLVLSLLSVRAAAWRSVQVPFLTVLAFTWVTTAATVVHADRLHMNAPGEGPFATPAAWVWVVVYALVPPAMVLALVLQRRAGRTTSVPTVGEKPLPLPRLLAAALVVEGALMAVAGGLLLAAGRTGWWPWELTPFTARVTAAWLLAFGLAAALAVRVGDLRVLRVSTIAYTVFGLLQVLAAAAHAEDLTGGDAAVVAWLSLMAAVLLTGAAGWWWSATSAPGPPRPAGQRGRD